MTPVEEVGQTQLSTSNLPSLAPLLDSSSSANAAKKKDCLFLADGIPVYPFIATSEECDRIIDFHERFPLSSITKLTPWEVLQRILSPTSVYVCGGEANVMFENIIPGLNAHTGFVFWDRKVAGHERFLREVYKQMIKMLGLRRITAKVPLRNRVMWRMFERIGFKKEGEIRDMMILPNGQFTNILIYGILYEELWPFEKKV